jgi:pteridine reductase
MERTPVGEVTVDAWDAMFALNLRAPFFAAQAAGAVHGRARRAIVNIADLAAFETWPAYVPHGITKAGVVQMTRALARALAPRVRVNAVAPGVVMLPDRWDETSAERLRRTTPSSASARRTTSRAPSCTCSRRTSSRARRSRRRRAASCAADRR